MKPQLAARWMVAAFFAAFSGASVVTADHFRYVPLDEGAGHTHYRIVDQAGTTLLVVRARAEYASLELRARDIVDRLDQAVDNLHEHGDLYLEVEWPHGRPVIHQVSRDGMVHFMIAEVTPGDIEGARRRERIRDPVALARLWLDSVDAAVTSQPEKEPPDAEGTESHTPEGSAGASVTEESEPESKISTGISMVVEPADAAVYLDDAALRPEHSWPIGVSPGRHTIVVMKPGFRPLRKEVEVQKGRIVRLEVRLEPEETESR